MSHFPLEHFYPCIFSCFFFKPVFISSQRGLLVSDLIYIFIFCLRWWWWWWWWWWNVFWYSWRVKCVKPYFHPKPLSEILTTVNPWHVMHRTWTCAEPEFRLCWMDLCSSDDHNTNVSFTSWRRRQGDSFHESIAPNRQPFLLTTYFFLWVFYVFFKFPLSQVI